MIFNNQIINNKKLNNLEQFYNIFFKINQNLLQFNFINFLKNNEIFYF